MTDKCNQNEDETSEDKYEHSTEASTPTSSSPAFQSSVICNKLVLSILITETAERVAYFGFRAILVLYFTLGLQFSDTTAVALCAATVALAYLSPLLGAVLADSIWGRFQTIWIFGVTYAIGLWLLTIAAYSIPSVNYNDAGDDDTSMNDGNNQMKVATVTERYLLLEQALTFVGLFLVCTGTGGIKPCVSAFGADQVVLNYSTDEICNKIVKEAYGNDSFMINHKSPLVDGSAIVTKSSTAGGKEQIREFFNSFYFCINVGALGSFAIIPVVRARWGFGAAFLIPTLFMMAALLVFRSQKNAYIHRKRDETQPSLFQVFQVFINILKERIILWLSGLDAPFGSGPRHLALSQVEEESDDESSEEPGFHNVHRDASQALHILPLMAFFPVFWMLYDQQGSVWTLQATRLKLHGLEPEQLQVLNPLEIMIFIPLFDLKIYPWLENHRFNIQPLRRMEYGMFLTAVSFVMSAWLEHRIQLNPPSSVSVAWQIPQITVLTVAEIFLNVTGLEFAYSQAPANMQALILALYLFMTAIGDGFAGLLYGSVLAHLSTAVAMILCAFCMLLNLTFFSRVSRRWKPYSRGSVNYSDAWGLELGPVNHIEHQH